MSLILAVIPQPKVGPLAKDEPIVPHVANGNMI